MEPRGLWPWEIVVICGVLVVAAYAIGSSSHSEEKPEVPAEAKPNPARDEEFKRLQREQNIDRQETAAQIQELTLKLQTAEASRTLEKQSFQEQQSDLEEKLRDAKADLRSEQDARESLEENLRDSNDQLRDLEQDYKDLKRRFEEETNSLRANFQNVSHAAQSSRVAAYPLGYSGTLSPREARVAEWRSRFQSGQEARDAYNAWLEERRESDFAWATSRLNIEDGTVDWPELLTGPAFVSHRSQLELAVRTGDVNKLSTAADGALVLLKSRARQHGRSAEAYLSAKRFLSVVKDLSF